MIDKIKGLIKENKVKLIVLLIVWIAIAILLIAPIVNSIYTTVAENGSFDIYNFITHMSQDISNPLTAVQKIFEKGLILPYLKALGWSIVASFVFAIIVIIRNKPKHEYTGIENGSSGWSEHGEQYKILNKNKGIILSENNYLPLDKRGNINVLVVGRIRFW